ncbi:MAG: hypothetical protein JSV91_14705 [Phycisphaerales bacterium]|nr:MAG: hypothetical protein JSV91_14705 [Phycisphaerales bacterium]
MLRIRYLNEVHLGGAMVALVSLSVLAERSVRAEDVATVVRHDADGVRVIERTGPARPRSADPRSAIPAWTGPRDGEILWHNYLEEAIYTTAGISIPQSSLITGTWLNPPMEAQLIALEGDGTPTWTMPGTQFEVAASRDADVFAAIDYDDLNVTVYKWHAASGTPDWSYVIGHSAPASHRAVAVSADGTIIAVLVTAEDGRGLGRLYYFGPDSSTPLGIIDAGPGTFGRNLSITPDGRYVAFIAGLEISIVDCDAGTLRYRFDSDASSDPITISGDGQYLAYGWLKLYVRQWDGSAYSPLFARTVPGYYLRQCTISADAGTLVSAWYISGFRQNRVELHELPSSQPLWTYDYVYGAGDYQDIVYDMALTADGGYVAAASLGDQVNTNPEVHVFEHDGPTPVFTLDTPGSMFDVDIAEAPDGTVYLSACGKTVHANEQGRGGDIYSILLVSGCPADVNADSVVDIDDLFQVLGMWGPCEDCPEDINNDGVVDIDDIFAVLADWGPCP